MRRYGPIGERIGGGDGPTAAEINWQRAGREWPPVTASAAIALSGAETEVDFASVETQPVEVGAQPAEAVIA
jgi:hypothetical protein